MLEVRHVRDLHLQGGGYVSAASGLVALSGGRLLVVADDQPLLAVFPPGLPGIRTPLTDEVMPADEAERKAVKPDLESLALLTGNTVVAFGSGSTERRERGWIWRPGAEPEEISLSRLYARLRADLPDLNIEGAARTRDGFFLGQRGNGSDGFNAVVEVDLPGRRVRAIRRVELPEAEGVPLTLSDLAPDRSTGALLFAAVAEATESTYHDGECVGSAVGRLDPRSGEVLELERLAEPWKVEGLTQVGGELLMTADPDDPERPAPLLTAPAPW